MPCSARFPIFNITKKKFNHNHNWQTRKKSVLLAQWPFGGVSSCGAKFQELVASSSNSLKFLTHHRLKCWIPKWSDIAHKRLFTSLSSFTWWNNLLYVGFIDLNATREHWQETRAANVINADQDPDAFMAESASYRYKKTVMKRNIYPFNGCIKK